MKDFSQITFTIRIYLAPKTKSWISSSAVVPMSLWENLVFPWISSKKYNSKTPSILLSLSFPTTKTHIYTDVYMNTHMQNPLTKRKHNLFPVTTKYLFTFVHYVFEKNTIIPNKNKQPKNTWDQVP